MPVALDLPSHLAPRYPFPSPLRTLNPPCCAGQVLSSMGLQAEVPLCSIKLSPPDAALLQINSDELLHLPRTPQVRTHSQVPVNAPDICGTLC